MPLPGRGAPLASTSRRSSIRRPVSVVLGVAIALGVPFVALPSITLAGACDSGWSSRKAPPPVIRVLRTKDNTVDRVDFRTYVAIVMASGEFPTWLPTAAIEVGATAVKQYAWYYTLDGHHRDGYRTGSGVCYDVRDDTVDQLYRPEKADPTRKQLDALAATWALTLRKNDRFFLTGYRYGDNVSCAQDTDGWHIFEQSIQDCADKGWSRQRIQEAYYAPRIDFVWADGQDPAGGKGDRTKPVVLAPRVSLRTDVRLGGNLVTLAWGGSDAGGSGLARYRLQRSVDGAEWQDVALVSNTQTRISVDLAGGHQYRFRTLARDKAGNRSGWATGAAVAPEIVRTTEAALTGQWTTGPSPAAVRRRSRSSVHEGATATLAFSGRAVALVAHVGPYRGKARLFVDGKDNGFVDLQGPRSLGRRVVWSRAWDKPGTHTIRLVVMGTPNRPRFQIDGFLVLH